METASICIALWQNKYYLQVAIAESQTHYFIPISKHSAYYMRNIEIHEDIEISKDMITK